MNIKKLGVECTYAKYDELKQRGVVAQGWIETGDISFLWYDKTEDISKYLPLTHVEYSKQGCKNAFKHILREIKPGDIILAFEGNTLKGICEIPPEFIYFYDDNYIYKNCLFPVQWVDWTTFCNEDIGHQGGQGVSGIENCGLDNVNNYIEKHWKQYKADNSIEIQPPEHEENLRTLQLELPNKIKTSREYYNNLLNKQNRMDATQYYIKLLEVNKNLILTGAPGTGKTYLAQQIAMQMIGLTTEELEKSKQYDFVQFHPSYDYTDFVEGLRPVKKGETLGFERKDGVFKEFCKNAISSENKNTKYVFIIDEINRGEISKIFGELFFSIDPGYRGPKGKVKTQYTNLIEDKDDIFKDGFYVPENVYIIGTMNDIDRSVESFDFAMRRRFIWEEIKAEDSAKNMKLPDYVKTKMDALNSGIAEIQGLNSSYFIGAAYFLGLRNDDGTWINEEDCKEKYDSIWELRLKSLLFEYLRGMQDAEKNLIDLKNAYNLQKKSDEDNG
jgi:5-methylcytosine-specific restriction endonuclease McrBC GTP-binding regulatory subunit McrB